jgi:putative heme transporter
MLVRTMAVPPQRGELSDVFVAPRWLRDAGFSAWLLVGIGLAVVGAMSLVALTGTIVNPVVTAAIIAAVSAPLVEWLGRHHIPRGGASALVLLGIIALGVVVGVIVIGGVTSQSAGISERLHSATDKLADALKDAGVRRATADHTTADASSGITSSVKLLLNGFAHGISQFASLAVFLSFTALSLFFLLKDGPSLRSWIERHSGVPEDFARVVSEETLRALRGYFTGVTFVALFNAALIGVGALILGVPLPGTIAIVTFLGAYVPYLGAWTAGAFAVLMALGGPGPEAALAMGVIALLANGALQQLVQPLAMGAALNIHPLAVLIVTIAGGAIFGMFGLVLAAPITSAIVQISQRMSQSGSDHAGPGERPDDPDVQPDQ